jgi:hypothetical protein
VLNKTVIYLIKNHRSGQKDFFEAVSGQQIENREIANSKKQLSVFDFHFSEEKAVSFQLSAKTILD